MKKILSFTCFLVAINGSAQFSEEKILEERMQTMLEAMLKPDAEVLASLVGDELEYVHSSGTVRNKQGFVDEFVNGQTKLVWLEFLDQTIHVTENTAIVRHRWNGEMDYQNTPTKLDIIALMVWKKIDDDWKMIARQAAKIPE